MDSPRQTTGPGGSSFGGAEGGRAEHPFDRPFERLVAIVSDERTAAEPAPALRRFGSPSGVDRLFRAALVAAVRRGPAADREGWGPARLIEVAGRAAQGGAAPAATAPALRGVLRRLEERLTDEGLWRPAVPLWWHPLPASSTPERVWSALDDVLGPNGGLPSPRHLAETLASPAGSGWSVIGGAFDEALVGAMHRELAALGRGDVLTLVRGGVGAEDRASSARSDRVAYVTGLEPELLAAAPTVAIFAQWLLHRLARRLAESLPGGLHAPMSAMLARYAAPCRGFAPHLDNPGGEQDNARAVTVVAYLNAPHAPCVGGELSLWGPGRPGRDGGRRVVSPVGGTLALFDSRRVVHEVLALQPGPDRWTAVVWLSDAARPVPILAEPPEPTPAEALEPLGDEVPAPEGSVLLRTLDAEAGATVRAVPLAPPGPIGRSGSDAAGPRVGIVCTTARTGRRLEAWCRHHLGLGFDHLLVVLDRPAEEPSPAGESASAPAVASRLGARIAGATGRLTVWSSDEAARRWGGGADAGALLRAARRGPATDGVAARQTLNATAALAAARAGELGGDGAGAPLDWLLHLDDDELLHLEGAARGGASVAEHFAALEVLRREAPGAFASVRYPNHELLLTREGSGAPRFKRNPVVAADRLGPVGWRRLVETLGMEQQGRRPYFRAYWNGKSAVAVERGRAAAGVHGWRLGEPAEPEDRATGDGGSGAGPPLIGPSILHLHLPSAAAFREKYLAVARAAAGPGSGDERAFPPSPLEERAVALIRRLQRDGAGGDELAARLDAFFRETLCRDADEVELLDAAGLLFPVDLDLTPWTP